MRCQTCGEELREGARFCPTCGTPTQPGAAQTPPTVQLRRTAPSSSGQSPEATAVVPPAAAEQVREPSATERPPEPEPAPRPSRDPGAGYDPVGPPRPASQSGARRPAGASSTARPAGGLSFTAPSSADFNTLVQRLLRLARLDTGVFGELYADAGATIPVAVFAAVVLVISGLGGMLFINSLIGFDIYGNITDGHSAGEFFLLSVILGTVFGLVALGLWSGITMGLLKQFGGVDADILGLARVFGVAIIPLVLSLLLFIDSWFLGLGWIAMGAVGSLAIIGVLEAVDVRPGPAWIATLAGFAAFVVLLTLLGDSTRDLAPGFFVGG